MTFAAIKKLLLSRDLTRIREGVAHAVELNDEAIWNQLLDGIEWTPPTLEQRGPTPVEIPGRLKPNRVFDWNTVSQPWNEMAMVLLVAASPSPLRETVTSLRLDKDDSRADATFRFSLIGLDGFPNLSWIKVTRAQDLEGLATCPALTRLQLIRSTGELPSLPELTSLEVRQPTRQWCVADGSWPNLTHLDLLGATADDLLPGAPNLTTLTARQYSGDPSIVSGSNLETVHIDYERNLAAPASFREMPRCTSLHFGPRYRNRDQDWIEATIHGLPKLTDLQLRHVMVELSDCPAVASLTLIGCAWESATAMPSVTSMALTDHYPDELDIELFPNVDELAVPTIPFTSRIAVPAGARIANGTFTARDKYIEDLGNLAELANLEVLDLSRRHKAHRSVLSLEPLQTATHLRALSLRNRHVGDLSPLIGLPELRYVDAHETSLTKADVPPELRKVVRFAKKQHSLEEARRRPHPSKKTPRKSKPRSTTQVSKEARPTLTKLKKLLLSRDTAAIAQGVELTAALNDPEVWKGLLSGVTYDPAAELPARKVGRRQPDDIQTFGRFTANELFTGASRHAQVWHHDLAVTALVAQCPIAIDGDAPLRDSVVGLTLGDWYDKSRSDVELSMQHLSGFPNLTRLQLLSHRRISNLGALSDCPALIELDVVATGHDLAIPPSATLETLSISREQKYRRTNHGPITIAPATSTMPQWPALTAAHLHGEVTDWPTFLRGAPKLTSLTSIGPSPDTDALAASAVESLSVTSHERDRPFALRNAAALASIEVTVAGPLLIEHCDLLTEVTAKGWASPTAEVRNCPQLTSIEMTHIVPTGFGNLPKLQALSLTGFAGLPDPSILEQLDGLPEFSISEARTLEVLTVPPRSGPVDGFLDLSKCAALVDLGNVATMVGLRGLFVNVQTLASVDALRDATDLEVLDIRGSAVTDLSPLVGLPKLHTVYIAHSEVTNVPTELQDVINLAAKPSMTKVKERLADPDAAPPPKKKKAVKVPVAGVSTNDWARVLVGLSTDDLEIALTTADFAVSLGPETVEYLLSKVSISKTGKGISSRAPIRLGDPTLRVSVVARLLKHAPPDSPAAAPIRDMTELVVSAKKLGVGRMTLDDLDAFTSLTRLDIGKCAMVTSADLSNTSIDTVKIRCMQLANFRGGPALQQLQLVHNSPALDLSGIANSPVHTLIVTNTDAATLTGCQSLRRLYVTRSLQSPEALHQIPLTHLHAVRTPLDTWMGHPTLKQLIRVKNVGRLAPIPAGLGIAVETRQVYARFELSQLPLIEDA